MLLQIDGSQHDWLEGRGPRLVLIADVAARHASLSRYIERRLASDRVDHRELVRLLSLYQTSASRLGRLFQDRRTQEEVTERLRDLVAAAPDQV